MNIDQMSVMASGIGHKLQSEFLKLFSSEIEQSEIDKNQPENEPEAQKKLNPF